VSTIWNGIDVSRFTYAGAERSGPAVMVGRLSPEKDVSTLLDAIPLVLRTCPSFRLKIAGGGECLTPLQQQAGKLGITGSVDFLGEVRDVASLLAQASLFVLPSLTEGMSLTLLEAMARGLPVVATRVGGNAEVVVDGETGLLVPPRSPAGLADAMLQVYADAERARRMGQAGRERVELHFDVRRMVVDYEALYRKVLESKTRRLLTRWTNPHKAVVAKIRPKRHSSARTAL
jgi:glycosyltransferase involved in cell wall biosynthesis